MSQVAQMTDNMPGGDANTAATEAAPEIVSEFPAPPAFFVLYRDGADSGPPPPAPLTPTYHMFGTPYSTLDAVPDLLPQPGRKLYAPEGAASSAASSASGSPSSAAGAAGGAQPVEPHEDERVDYKAQMKNDKLDDLELLFLNMHNLINAFRPHQARETIIEMLKAQIQERRDAAQDIRRTIDESRKAVELVHADLHEAPEDASREDTSDRARETRQMQEDFFSALDAALEG
ncbi:hypothetical protein PybrP1_006385 [[Pythium] brassicae (nom. inval.)]|nr:hypothetical protein PybrP1_006385 [[Pythium] brassicae (nom. inval.)]